MDSTYFDDSIPLWEAVELEVPQFGKKAVERAGKLLRARIESVNEESLQTFEVAHNWRNSHLLPMRKMRNELAVKAKRVNPSSISAGRLKRMKSIRKKLSRLPYTLYQMQDIGGCRAIMSSMSDVDRVVSSYEESAKHNFIKAYDYIQNPKRGGYRSHHRVYMFNGYDEEEQYKHQLIELQVRTQLQHAWATAVEAVGLVRNEDLKSGEGDADWLRFFELMSSEFAVEEGCPLIPGTPENRRERREEIRDLEQRLAAVSNLSSYVQIIDTTANVAASRGNIFLIQYNPMTQEVSAKAFSSYIAGSKRYEMEEASAGTKIDTVLVEVDKAADLRSAYPNYYLDVGMFLGRLRDVTEEKHRTLRHSSQKQPWGVDWWRRER